MAFINRSFAKDELFVRVGKVSSLNQPGMQVTGADCTTVLGNKTDTTGNKLTGGAALSMPISAVSAPGQRAIDIRDNEEVMKNKVIVFDNGAVKNIKKVHYVVPTAGTTQVFTEFEVEPTNVRLTIGTGFKIHDTILSITDKDQILFGKTHPDISMQGPTDTGIDLNFGKIRNAALPTHAHDVATKQYVDSLKVGIWNHIEVFEGDGFQSIFDITVPISIYNALISVGGVIQKPFVSYEFEHFDSFTRINFLGDPPPAETDVTIRASTATNVEMSPSIEEIFEAVNNQDTFLLENEILDKFGLLISIDGVVQSTLNYEIMTTPAQVTTDATTGNLVYVGNEYKILKFAEPLSAGAIVRVLNIRGKGFHAHTGTQLFCNDTTFVPKTTVTNFNDVANTTYDTIANSNNTITVSHDMIAHRGGLHIYANTTCDDLYINLPQMGGGYSPDSHLEIKVVKNTLTQNVWINAYSTNFMNYEGVLDGHAGGGVVYNQGTNVPAVIHLEWESFYKTWYIKYGMGLWQVNANTVNYPAVSPY